MITLNDIDLGIKKLILNSISSTKLSGVTFSSTSIEEEIIRPAFYITYPNNTISKLNKRIKSRVLNVRLFYFAKNRKGSKNELVNITEFIEPIFSEDLNINDIYFPVNEVEFDIDDKEGYLTVDFELLLFEDIKVEEVEPEGSELDFNI